MKRLRTPRGGRLLVALLVAGGLGACGGDGRTVELSIHYRQLPDGGLGAVARNGLRICRDESDVGRIHVTVESIPPEDTMPDEFIWTCEELSRD